VTIGMVYGYLPFMVLPIYAAIERFDFKLVEAAHDLGGNDWTAFWRIIFPLTLPGVIAGSILVFIPALGTYVTADMLGGTRGRMIGSLIYGSFRGTGNWTRGAATSMVMMAIVAVVLVIYALVAQRTENTPRQAAKRRSADVLSRSYALIAAMIAPITGAISHQVTLLSDELTRRRQVFWLKPELRMKRDLLIRKIAPIAIWANAAFCYIFLWVPIIILVVYSFNDANSTVAWRGFTTSWYSKLLSGGINVDADLTTELLLQSIKVSLIVGVAATLISTIVGMMVSLSMARSRFIGKRPLEGLLYLPVGIPEITQGISLLVFFNIAFDYLAKHWDITMRSGYTTLILSHVAFCIPFVAIVVRARLANMNPHFEEAARDLGANEWRTFWRVTFPLMLPGVIAGALLAFTLSLDDFIISEFTKGLNTSTLTVVVYSMAKRSVTPQINAISTLMILVSTLLVGLSLVLQGRSAGRT
jgi:spermidine/putrescine transport system permease protein